MQTKRKPIEKPSHGAEPKGAPLEPRQDTGHGRRLIEAFAAMERLPALAESRRRLLRVAGPDGGGVSEVVDAVEADVALAITVLRFANRKPGAGKGSIATVAEAVEALRPDGVRSLGDAVSTYEFFEHSGGWGIRPERFRLHAVATRAAADRLVRAVDGVDRDLVASAALLHDVGKLVLARAYPAYPGHPHSDQRTPEQRLDAERRELGIDHALVGGVLLRRWGMPKRLSATVERHHSEDATGAAAVVRLADMLAHYAQGDAVSPKRLQEAASKLGIDEQGLNEALYEMPYPRPERRRSAEPCPLSGRELDVLRELASGKVYKQIAAELSLSASTVRTHLHNVYGKIGAVDRAQAVLIATSKGWI